MAGAPPDPAVSGSMETEDAFKGVVRTGTVSLRALVQEVCDLGWESELAEAADAVWEDGMKDQLAESAVMNSLVRMAELGRTAAERACPVWRLRVLRAWLFFVGTEEAVAARVMDLLKEAKEFAKRFDEPDVFPAWGASFDEMAWAVARTALLADSRRARPRFKDMHGKAVQRCVAAVRTSEGCTAVLRYPGSPEGLSGVRRPTDWEALKDLFETVRLHGLPD